jgi:16S rRNA (cytidine1402-2'-O)-methyltransferase
MFLFNPLYMLYLVSTPIGNLEDITLRALRVLKEVSLIAAEDTRQTRKLLTHFQIKNDITSFNDLNKDYRSKQLVEMMKQGKDIALVSDAGTPGISDPGFYLTRECVRNNIKIVPVPGATAIISALVCSGLPTDRFAFYGFIPKKPGQKESFLKEIAERKETTVFYESPYRILKTLGVMAKILPSHQIVLARELTKLFEEFVRGTPEEVLSHFEGKAVKGEFVVIVGSQK